MADQAPAVVPLQQAPVTPQPAQSAPEPKAVADNSSASMNDALKDLASLYNESEPPKKEAVTPDKNGKPGKSKATENPAPKKAADVKDANGEEAPVEEVPANGKPEKRESPWKLVHKYEKDISDLRRQLEEKSKPVEDVEKKSLSEWKSKSEQRIKELEEELEYSSFERSDKYKQQYETPFVDAFMLGREKAASLNISDGNGGTRKGTAEDFDKLMRITDDDSLAEKAFELFGPKAPVVLYHVERVKELNAAKNKAVEDYRNKGSERYKQMQEQYKTTQKQQEEQAKALTDEFNNARKAAVDKFDWLRPKDGAEKRNELLQKGFELSDRAFSNGEPLKDGQKELSPVELSRLRAAMYNKASAFDAVRHEFKEALSKISELEEKLKQYEESEPSGGVNRGEEPKRFGNTMDAAVDGLLKLAR